MDIAVIGAGASGMMAALQAAWNGAPVTLLERNEQVGRKLLVTGSGRCNITNRAAAAEKYACADPGWMRTLLDCFGVDDLLAMLAEIGVPVHCTDDGWYYPLSNSAHTVVEAFASAMQRAGVTLITGAKVTSLRPGKAGFHVRISRPDGDQTLSFTQVIVSAGGAAYPSLGSRGELFPALEKLGHTVLPSRPALAPLLVNLGSLRALQGVRLDAGVTLWDGSRRLGSTVGNLIFTEWGLNGPAVMDLSHLVSAHGGPGLELSLNLLARVQAEYDRLLSAKRSSDLPLKVFLGAFFPPKVSAHYLRMVRLPDHLPLRDLGGGDLKRLTALLTDTRLPVKGTREFEYCQVSAGGVPVTEVDPRTLQSLRVEGLFLTGETLNVVGPCGGYNLQYAFSSGALAGRAAAKV